MDEPPKFVQISTAAAEGVVHVYGLDVDGRVWHYVPENKATKRWAFWVRLTNWRSSQKKSTHWDEEYNEQLSGEGR